MVARGAGSATSTPLFDAIIAGAMEQQSPARFNATDAKESSEQDHAYLPPPREVTPEHDLEQGEYNIEIYRHVAGARLAIPRFLNELADSNMLQSMRSASPREWFKYVARMPEPVQTLRTADGAFRTVADVRAV